jgi:hypothetical protein
MMKNVVYTGIIPFNLINREKMTHRFVRAGWGALAAGLVTASSAAEAQNAQCLAQPLVARDACQKVVDLFSYVAPSLGSMITGGNATLGQIGSIGSTGHFSFGVRIVGMQTNLPQVQNLNFSATGPQQSNFPTKQQWAGFPTADVAVGLFPGVSLGAMRIASVDALVNLAYVPKIKVGEDSIVVPHGSFKAGFGARVGLVDEDELRPAIAFTVLRRDLPTIGLSGGGLATNSGDSLFIDSLDIHTTSWRITAGKHAGILGAVIGIGKDHYNSNASMHAVVPGSGTSAISVSQSVDRTNLFADVNVLFLHAEVGRVSGSKVPTYNTFAGTDPSAGQTYFATGIRLGF